MLSLLETKGHVRHRRDGIRYLYSPVIAPSKARQSALRHLVSTFFEGSTPAAGGVVLEGLTTDDFTLFEDGKPQAIKVFECGSGSRYKAARRDLQD